VTETLSIADHLRLHAAQRAFEAARLRYVRGRVAQAAAAGLRPLQHERIALLKASERLQAALDFHEGKVVRARARYERGRAGRAWGSVVERPTFLERIGTLGFSDHLYRNWRLWMFCREEVFAELSGTRSRLSDVLKQMNAIVQKQEALVERKLGTPAGLREALASDDHLALAHSRLRHVTTLPVASLS
jgi:hypothetical protein